MNRLPQRLSLVTQTAAVLKDEIKAGRWTERLPGEKELCTLLHVGRDTLRSAVGQLQKEGWVRRCQGKRSKIVRRRREVRSATNRVVLLTPVPLHKLLPTTMFWIDSLREHLSQASFELEIHDHPACFSRRPDHALEALAVRLNVAGWVLSQSTASMQKWFAARMVPCVVTGSRHKGVPLPSVDRDHRAISRHAAGALLARGHRRLALVGPSPVLAGDLESEEGFKEGVGISAAPQADCFINRHDGTVPGISAKLDLLLKRYQPTGFLVSRSNNVLTVISYLMMRGLRFPTDVGLISRDDDSFLDSMLPTVARYSLSSSLFARKVSSLVVQMVRGGVIRPAEHLLMPEFVHGQTLG